MHSEQLTTARQWQALLSGRMCTFCFCVLRSHMKTPPAVGNSPLRSELEPLRPITPGRENCVISLVRTLEEGSPGEVRLLVRKPDPMWWVEELAAAAKAKVEVDGPQAIDRILKNYMYTVQVYIIPTVTYTRDTKIGPKIHIHNRKKF